MGQSLAALITIISDEHWHRARTANICFKKLGLSQFAGRESLIGGSMLRRKISANIPQLHKAKKR